MFIEMTIASIINSSQIETNYSARRDRSIASAESSINYQLETKWKPTNQIVEFDLSVDSDLIPQIREDLTNAGWNASIEPTESFWEWETSYHFTINRL